MIRIFLGMKAQYIKTEMEYAANFWMMLLSGVLSRVVSMAGQCHLQQYSRYRGLAKG